MSTKRTNIIFLGTPDFAVPSLNELIKDSRFKIDAVFTQPDKKAGRGMELTPSPVKLAALKNNIPVFQPEKIKTESESIKKYNALAAVLIAYGQIIPKSIIDIPKFGFINIHASLLPKYRGSSCIQAAILNGDEETGITIMKIDSGLDTGPVIHQEKIKIEKTDTSESLHDKLALLGAEIIPDVLAEYLNGKIAPVPQDDSKAIYAPELKREDGKINWNDSAEKIERMSRAYYPWPGIYTKLQNKKIKIKKIDNIIQINKFKIGEFFLYDNGLAVRCGSGAIIIDKLQLEGKKEMSSEEFLHGHSDFIGKILE